MKALDEASRAATIQVATGISLTLLSGKLAIRFEQPDGRWVSAEFANAAAIQMARGILANLGVGLTDAVPGSSR